MRFHLYLDCDNAAFDGRLGDEVARILTIAATMVDAGKLDASIRNRDTVRLRDMNGNTVGRYWIEASDVERRQRNTADAYAHMPSER